jgi:hypothetical protein
LSKCQSFDSLVETIAETLHRIELLRIFLS